VAAGKRVNASVRQDKARIASAREATPQPAAETKITRAKQLNRNTPRATNGNTAKTTTVHLDLWVSPIAKAELQRIAEHEIKQMGDQDIIGFHRQLPPFMAK
jgi:hypothetical protein